MKGGNKKMQGVGREGLKSPNGDKSSGMGGAGAFGSSRAFEPTLKRGKAFRATERWKRAGAKAQSGRLSSGPERYFQPLLR